MEPIEIKDVYNALKAQYDEGISRQDAKMLNAFVRDDRVLSFKTEESRIEYLDLRLKRTECFILFGSFNDAVKECRLALAFANEKQHWKIYMLWTKVYAIQFVHETRESALQAIAQALVQVAQKGRLSVKKSSDSEYQILAFANVEAFFQTYLGNKEEAKAIYSTCQFTPVPISQYNDKAALDYLFSNYAKGLAVAIELQDEKLLRNLLKVISIDDQTLYSKQSLFKVFHNTLVTTMDTHPQFEREFNQLFALSEKIKEPMKNLNFFLTSISSNMHQALDTFFNVFK